MKKSIYLLMMSFGLVFTACEPMEDIHDDLDARLDARPNFGNVEFTFSDDDYEALDLDFGNFSTVEDANEMIPGYLSTLYPVLGEGSIANVTVDIYNPAVEVENFSEVEVTEEEYTELGFKYGNFDSADDMIKYLDYKFPDAAEGDAVELTYEYYAGSTSTRTTTHVYDGETWAQVETLTKEDYTEMGERFPNFNNREDAIADLSNWLRLRYPYAQEGDVKTVMYARHIGGGKTVKNLDTFTFNGTKWTADGSVVQTTLQFGHNGSEWEPDNTIQYTLEAADFAAIGAALTEKYPDPAWSAGNYSNFDRRVGNRNYWSEEMLLEAVNIALDRIAPNAEEGQKYVVSFAIYDGSAGTESLSVIKQGGEWVLQ